MGRRMRPRGSPPHFLMQSLNRNYFSSITVFWFIFQSARFACYCDAMLRRSRGSPPLAGRPCFLELTFRQGNATALRSDALHFDCRPHSDLARHFCCRPHITCVQKWGGLPRSSFGLRPRSHSVAIMRQHDPCIWPHAFPLFVIRDTMMRIATFTTLKLKTKTLSIISPP